MRYIVWLILLFAFLQAKEYSDLRLEEAIKIVKKQNLEIQIADFDQKVAALQTKIAKGYNYGKLDLIQLGMRSNDAGNVFGFKLQSREASFADFGFDEFLYHWGAGSPPDVLLSTEPEKLNYPDARNHFQTKLSYMVPLYTGGKLTQYENISKALQKMSGLDKDAIVAQKLYQTKKSFYDIALLDSFIKNLTIIKNNIQKLQDTVKSMIEEGYAKKIDLLEVESKKASVERLLNIASLNRDLVYEFLSFLLDAKVSSIAAPSKEVDILSMSKEEMLKRNIDIQKAKKGYEIQSMMVDVQKSAFLPEIGFFAELSSSDDKPLNDLSDHDAYTIGFQIKYNIYNGQIDKNKLEQAKINKMKVKKQVSLAKKGIALKISKIKTEIKSYDFSIKSLKKELEFTQAVYENYLGRYEQKLVSINDVIIKQSEQIEKVLKLKEIQNRRNERVFELEKIANGDRL